MAARSPVRVVVFLALLLALGLDARGASIQVLVRISPLDAKVGPIQVFLTGAQGGEQYQSITLYGERTCAFEQVRSGSYVVRVESPGFESAEAAVTLNAYNRMDHAWARLTLVRREGPPEALPDDGEATVSVRSLAVPAAAVEALQKAEKASRANQPQKAVGHLRRALEIHPDFYQAYNNLAVEYTRLGRLEDAAAALEESVRLHPEDSTSHRNLAQIYLSFNRLEEALAQVHQSFELEPASSKSYLLLGNIYLRNGTPEPALASFYEAARIEQGDRAPVEIAECLARLGRFQEALEELRTFLDSAPSDPRVPAIRGTIARLEAHLRAGSD